MPRRSGRCLARGPGAANAMPPATPNQTVGNGAPVPPFPAALLAALARQGYTVLRISLRGIPVWLIVPARQNG